MRPLATRLDVSLGQLRSLVGTRSVLSTTLEEIASKLGFTIMIHRVGEAFPDDDTPPWAEAIRDDIAKLRDNSSRDHNIWYSRKLHTVAILLALRLRTLVSHS